MLSFSISITHPSAFREEPVPLTISELMTGLNATVKENSIDSEHNIFTYKYSYSAFGMNAEGIILYSFSGSKCVAFASEWESGHPMAESIVDTYIASIK